MIKLIATLAALAVLIPGIASAADDRCPIESLDHAAVEQGLKAAPTCDASLKIFQKCSFGSSGDIRLGAIVTEKCEALFEGKLSPQQKSAYSRARHVCNTKYLKESGTMYRSFEAFCRAEAAHRMAKPFFPPQDKAANK